MSDKIKKFFEKDQFAAYIGAKLIEVKPGYAVATIEISDKHLNAVHIVQGGVIFTLADFAFAAASNSHGYVSLGINVNISYFKSSAKGTTLTAEAKEVSRNKKLANYDVDIFNEDRDLIARFNGTAYIKKDKIEFLKP